MARRRKKSKPTLYMQAYPFRNWSLFTDLDTIYKEFGEGIAFYFHHIRFVVKFMSVLSLLFLFPIIVNFIHDRFYMWDAGHNVYLPFRHYISGPIRIVLTFIAYLIALLGIRYLQIQRTHISRSITHQEFTAKDYSILIRGLPKGITDSTIKSFCEQHGEGEVHAIVRFSRPLLWRLRTRQATITIERHERIMRDLEQLVRPPPSCSLSLLGKLGLLGIAQSVGWHRDHKWYNKELERLAARAGDVEAEGSTQVAVVTFKQATSVPRILSVHKQYSLLRRAMASLLPFCSWGMPALRGRVPRMSVAPEPTDLIWGNLDSTSVGRFCKGLVTNLVSLLIIVVFSSLFIYWRAVQRSWSDGATSWLGQQVVYWAAYILIFLTDQILRQVIRIFAKMERHHTFTAEERARLGKYYGYSLLNKLTPIISRSVLAFKDSGWTDWATLLRLARPDFEWRHYEGGYDVTMLLVIEIFGFNLMDIAISVGLLLLGRWTAHSQYTRQKAEEGRPLPFSSLYTNATVLYTIVLAFAPAAPIIAPLSVVYYLIHTIVTRYRLLRITQRPPKLDRRINILAEKLSLFAVVVAGAVLGTYYSDENVLALPLCVLGSLILVLSTPLIGRLVHRFNGGAPMLSEEEYQRTRIDSAPVASGLEPYQPVVRVKLTEPEKRLATERLGRAQRGEVIGDIDSIL
eukprot:gnl/Dysnectes_brevis/4547_a6161_506.p1 GENE.gnl/Dysnectes_brevis/4547_a6161_506~~gnl/Dysnectes_brevis/4547_a6161_506.p1  ORF type:complete len:685 (-),score=168.01 gnl/Dysnectes_brevis/4547_a6161_506:44-2098(-)